MLGIVPLGQGHVGNDSNVIAPFGTIKDRDFMFNFESLSSKEIISKLTCLVEIQGSLWLISGLDCVGCGNRAARADKRVCEPLRERGSSGRQAGTFSW